jgi:hypothetical protein
LPDFAIMKPSIKKAVVLSAGAWVAVTAAPALPSALSPLVNLPLACSIFKIDCSGLLGNKNNTVTRRAESAKCLTWDKWSQSSKDYLINDLVTEFDKDMTSTGSQVRLSTNEWNDFLGMENIEQMVSALSCTKDGTAEYHFAFLAVLNFVECRLEDASLAKAPIECWP